MTTIDGDALAEAARPEPGLGLKPMAAAAEAVISRQAEPGELRRAAVTLLLALYPLVGSVTIVVAAILLAGGANAG